MIPAPGQGALAVECLDAAGDLAALLAEVDDPGSRAAVTAERTVLAELEAGCSAPLGAYAAGTDILQLTAAVIAVDGGTAVRASMSGPRRAGGQARPRGGRRTAAAGGRNDRGGLDRHGSARQEGARPGNAAGCSR